MHATEVDDRKAVIATVEPVHQLVARARIGGTIASLKVKEGDTVAAGAEIAMVADQKLALQMQALDSRIQSQQAQRDQAQDRLRPRRRSCSSAASARRPSSTRRETALDVAERTLAADARRPQRHRPADERGRGAGAGRRARAHGPGLGGPRRAARRNDRHARRGPVTSFACSCPSATRGSCAPATRCSIGARGLAGRGAGDSCAKAACASSIRRSRAAASSPTSRSRGSAIISSASARASTSTPASASAIIVPADYVFRRAGVNYVKLADGAEVVVQPGERERRRHRNPLRPARTATCWSRHEPRPFRRSTRALHQFAADAAAAAGGARRRRDRARRPAARGGAADQRADGRHHGHGQRLQGRRRGRARHPAARGHRQGHQRRRARLFADRRTTASSSPRASSSAPTRTPRSCASTRRSAPTSPTCPRASPSR